MHKGITVTVNTADRARLEAQERFMRAGVDGLLRDKRWPPRIPSLARAVSHT